jgi:hypothetical protein
LFLELPLRLPFFYLQKVKLLKFNPSVKSAGFGVVAQIYQSLLKTHFGAGIQDIFPIPMVFCGRLPGTHLFP